MLASSSPPAGMATRVAEVETAPRAPRLSVYHIKLTDECVKALKGARGAPVAIRFRGESIDSGGSILVSDALRFDFTTTDESAKVATAPELLRAPVADNTPYVWFGNITKKLTVQATERSYEDTKERAAQLQHETNQNRVQPSKAPLGGRVVKKSVSSAPKRHLPDAPTLAPPAKQPAVSAPQPPPSQQQSKLSPERLAQLLKRPLRIRLIHLLILKPQARDYVLTRVRREGLGEVEERGLDAALNDVCTVQTIGGNQMLMLKPKLYGEVDVNWPFYDNVDKLTVKRNLAKATNGNGGAPAKNGASTAKAPQNTAKKESIIDTLLPVQPPPPPPSTESAPPPPPPAAQEAAPASEVREKPTTKPSNAAASSRPQSSPIQSSVRSQPSPAAWSATAAKPPSSSVTPPTKPPPPPPPPVVVVAPDEDSLPPLPPTPDYETSFPAIASEVEYERYKGEFHRDYPSYMKAYKYLQAITDEFARLEKQWTAAEPSSKEHRKVEQQIVQRTEHYSASEDFARARRKHRDLRAKLALIKRRVGEWDEPSELSSPAAPPPPRAVDNLLVL